jgi:hypothetical protein
MIHTDGAATIASSGVPDKRLASVFGLAKPAVVDDAMTRERQEREAQAAEHFKHMNYGAWRVCESLLAHMLSGNIETVEDMLTTVRGLSVMYEALYRAAA